MLKPAQIPTKTVLPFSAVPKALLVQHSSSQEPARGNIWDLPPQKLYAKRIPGHPEPGNVHSLPPALGEVLVEISPEGDLPGSCFRAGLSTRNILA